MKLSHATKRIRVRTGMREQVIDRTATLLDDFDGLRRRRGRGRRPRTFGRLAFSFRCSLLRLGIFFLFFLVFLRDSIILLGVGSCCDVRVGGFRQLLPLGDRFGYPVQVDNVDLVSCAKKGKPQRDVSGRPAKKARPERARVCFAQQEGNAPAA